VKFAPVPFAECLEEESYGGKVMSLGVALRAGLPAPPGYGVEVELVNAVVAGNTDAIAAVHSIFDAVAPSCAVRSSAVGEDSADASFAGQHDSIMNVRSAEDVVTAIIQVYQSGHTESAMAYREKVGVAHDARIAVAVQQQIPSEKAGVLFTRNPISGDAERYIEVAWGLGEAVVSGLVVPDTFRISADGEILVSEPGDKDLKLILSESGSGTDEVDVPEELAEVLCLSNEELIALHRLAENCEQAYGQNLDMEFAFYQGELYLLQCRSITTIHKI
jgi:pyruvate,water dikinase